MSAYETRLGIYVAGRWIHGPGRETMDVLNPATGAVNAPLPLATSDELDEALEATRRGFALWRDTPPANRAAILCRTAQLLRERSIRVARTATLEQGKILAEAEGEVTFAAALPEFHAAEGQRIHGRALQRPGGTSWRMRSKREWSQSMA